MPITLEQLLQSREERRDKQKELLEKHPGRTLLCFTVVPPGSVKRNSDSLITAAAGVCALTDAFGSDSLLLRDLPTGFEAYLLTPMPPLEAKQKVCHIEETHPLGRLFDIDVLGQDGIPIERTSLGLPPRKCLLCEDEARACIRTGKHPVEELLSHIHEMVSAYV